MDALGSVNTASVGLHALLTRDRNCSQLHYLVNFTSLHVPELGSSSKSPC